MSYPRQLPEKQGPGGGRSITSTTGRRAIVFCQNILLWTAAYVMASTIYVIVVGAVNIRDLPSAVMYLVASSTSLFYLATQITEYDARRASRRRQRVAMFTIRMLAMLWSVASALCLTFTAARQPLCIARPGSGSSEITKLDIGATCVVNRVAIVLGLVAMLTSFLLFILLHKVDDPYRCHLFGIVQEHKLLPLFLPHKGLAHKPSEMSFKCRSSNSLSSQYGAPAWYEGSRSLNHSKSHSSMPPAGAGMYSNRASAPTSLLLPRPSLSSIRSHACLYIPPPTSPLPPLPIYIPTQRHLPAMTFNKAVHPPRRLRPIRPARSDESMYQTRPPPVLSVNNLAVHNRRSHDSLSSIYSRSISGESRTLPRMGSRPSLISDSRTSSSGDTITLKRSPLGLMTLAEDPDEVSTVRHCRTVSGASTTRCRALGWDEGGEVVEVKPLEIRKSSREREIDERLLGYVQSQNLIRQTSLMVQSPPQMGVAF